MIVAVDGPSGAGKSSVCREAARRLRFQILDTGAIYRCVALQAMQQNKSEVEDLVKLAEKLDLRFKPHEKGQKVILNGIDVTQSIRSYEVTQRVNSISPIPEVRAALLALQRRLAKGIDVIVEGRDIASVVFPDAALKIFYTASAQARAKRRLAEFQAKGESYTFEEVVEQIKQRDHSEYNREASPLIQHPAAIVLDTSNWDFEESCKALVALIQKTKEEWQ